MCSILGLPNVGKSTFLNQVLGMRLAAVSAKPQTTRNRILGVRNLTLSETCPAPRAVQTIYLDTPGIQRGKGGLREFMRDEALAAAADCDVALLMIDVASPGQRTPTLLKESGAAALTEALEQVKVPVVLALNKIDKVADKERLLPIIEAFAADSSYAAVVPISASKGKNIEGLEREIGLLLPTGPKLFPADMYTDRAERFLAAELVREQLFRQLGQELPYATAVLIESFKERRDKQDVVIHAVVYVERDSQKGIVVGQGGARIKEVGVRARQAISQLLACPVHLKLHVKVSRNWTQTQQSLRAMGYE